MSKIRVEMHAFSKKDMKVCGLDAKALKFQLSIREILGLCKHKRHVMEKLFP